MEDQAAFDAAWHGGTTDIPSADDPEFAHTYSNVGLVLPMWTKSAAPSNKPTNFVIYAVDGTMGICLLGDNPDSINFGGYIQDTLNNVRRMTHQPRIAWLKDGVYQLDPQS